MLPLSLLLTLAAGAAAAPTSSLFARENTESSNSTVDHHLTTKGFTSQQWIDGFKKAQSVVEAMTFDEKVNFTALRSQTRGCAGLTYPIEKHGVANICMGDGPTGINSRYSTQFPSEVTTAATWDVDLFTRRAEAMGKEYHDVGIHIPLSIVAGPMGRSPYGGRNWENWSPDPYLTAAATRLTVEGFQKHGVTGLVKHFVGKRVCEQEYLRIGANYGGYSGAKKNQTVDSLIDDFTAHELYIYPFAEAVRSGAGGIMCSYNFYNGTISCENDAVQNGLLKEELNMNGFVLSDWGAAFDSLPAAVNGTDIVQGSNRDLFGTKLGDLIKNGTVEESVLDDKVLRLLTPYFALNQQDLPDVDYSRWVVSKNATKTVLDVATSSLTLLKNVRSENNTRGLPLNKPRDLILVGSPASAGKYGIVSNVARFNYFTTDREWEGFVTDGFGSGGSPAPFAVDPYQGITARAHQEARPCVVDGYFSDNATEGYSTLPDAYRNNTVYFLDSKLATASSAIVFVSATAMEGYDRDNLSLALGGDDLIQHVASRHNDTIVVVTAPGPVDMSAWIDHENVTSVVYSYFPTTEGGNSIASVLFGDVSPSGKLPFTIASKVEDYNDARYTGPIDVNPATNFSEGVYIDYRYFDAKNITPLYEFGFGKSYSTFSFADLKVSQNQKKSTALVRETNEVFLSGTKATPGLYDRIYTVKAVVKNTGSVAAAEVAQLYLTYPSSVPRELPIRQLRGFAKPFLKPGQSKTVEFDLRNKDLAYYDVEQGGWVVPQGEFTLSVGSSSRELPLTTTLRLE
ncbi:hypothetical protein JCM6882_007319 [Rhodosporidiobolus microsporus]